MDPVDMEVLGDDSLGSVSSLAGTFFNMDSISKWCASVGVTYTMGTDKHADVVPFIRSTDATFLGRTFRKVGGLITGPLRKVAINDLLCYSVKVTGFTPEQVRDIRTLQAFRELVAHGRHVYDDYARRVKETQRTRFGNCTKIPTYTQFKEDLDATWFKTDGNLNAFAADIVHSLY